MDILALYQYCTFGGVERVFLNRAMALKSCGRGDRFFIGYLHDSGALSSFKEYIKVNGLKETLIPLLISRDQPVDFSRYDLILVIDTPQVLESLRQYRNVFIECHTPYAENRLYLRDIPGNIKGVIVPSQSFASLIKSEIPNLGQVHVLPNVVSEEFYELTDQRAHFTKRPLTFMARFDPLKNITEAIRLFQAVKDRDDIFHIVIGKGESLEQQWNLLEAEKLLQNTLFRERIPFHEVPALVNLVRQHKGVFLSPSKGESFGLSAAEFMCGRVPVLLSDIPAHRELVDQDERFLYPLGDIKAARMKLDRLLDDWEEMSECMNSFSRKFSYHSFLSGWKQFLSIQI